MLGEVNWSRGDIICGAKWLHSSYVIQTKNGVSMLMRQNYLQLIQYGLLRLQEFRIRNSKKVPDS